MNVSSIERDINRVVIDSFLFAQCIKCTSRPYFIIIHHHSNWRFHGREVRYRQDRYVVGKRNEGNVRSLVRG